MRAGILTGEAGAGVVMAEKVKALVLAASRKGADDPVARQAGVSHKCLAPIAGRVMLERVIDSLIDSGVVADIWISIESADLLRATERLKAWLDEGRIRWVRSEGNLADSVLAAARAMPEPFPLLVLTGDNALQTPELVRQFVDAFLAGREDVAIGFTREEVVKSAFPEVGLAYHRLKDGGWSATNLYGLRNERALKAVKVFRSGGQFGKRHWRILKSCGLMPFLLYKLKATTLSGLIGRVGRNLGVSAAIIDQPFPYAPIDVDNPSFFAIAERALEAREREKTASAADA